MIDIAKQVVYWRNGSAEDWQVAQDLVAAGRIRQGLFFAHLSLEKVLKAHVCKETQDLAPRIHNLVKLVEITGLDIDQEQLAVLADVNSYNLAGRYPDMVLPEPSIEQAKVELQRATEVYRWLMNRL